MKKITSDCLQTVINAFNDPVLVIDDHGNISLMNKAASVMSQNLNGNGYAGHLCSEASVNRAGGSDFQGCPVREVLRTGKPVSAVRHQKLGNAAPLVMEISASPLFGDAGEVIGALEIRRDITARKRWEEQEIKRRTELEKQHQELTRIFQLVEIGKKEWEQTMDCVKDMVILLDREGMIKRCNKSFKEFVQASYEEILGKDAVELLMNRGMQVQQFYNTENEVFCEATGQWFVISSDPVRGIDREHTLGTVMTIHDTTELKRITLKLEESNRDMEQTRIGLQHALDELSSLIQQVETEKAFDIRFTNVNLAKCYAIKNCAKTDCPCYGSYTALRCWQIAGSHCGGTAECAFVNKYEDCRECEVFQMATPNPILKIGEHFNNMMHILESKNKDLEQAYTKLKLTQAKILQQDKMASIGQLAAGVAHEVNNPMGFIASNLNTLNKYMEKIMSYIQELTASLEQTNSAPLIEGIRELRTKQKIDFIREDAQKLIGESLEGAERVKVIVQNLKNFSRVDQSEAKYADINECMESTIRIVWNELKYKTTVKKEYGDIPPLFCYPQQLNQVFMNLLVNAAHAIETRGEITIKTWAKDESVFISIADTGCGISEENLPKIFEPFFTTKEIGKGTGLGLSITFDIIKKHTGEIMIQSEVNKGTTFTIRIPIQKPERG
ncbi:MAG: ATP-binding protein [Nitrospirota bacterium]